MTRGTRRHLLATMGVGALAAVAGCNGADLDPSPLECRGDCEAVKSIVRDVELGGTVVTIRFEERFSGHVLVDLDASVREQYVDGKRVHNVEFGSGNTYDGFVRVERDADA